MSVLNIICLVQIVVVVEVVAVAAAAAVFVVFYNDTYERVFKNPGATVPKRFKDLKKYRLSSQNFLYS
jgi:nitrate/nitrite transporter NarK